MDFPPGLSDENDEKAPKAGEGAGIDGVTGESPALPENGEPMPQANSSSLDSGMEAVQPILEETELSSQSGAPVEGVSLPPPASTRRESLFTPEAMIEPGPLAGLPSSSAPELGDAKPERRRLLKLFVPKERLEDLWERASRAKEGVDSNINNLSTARQLLDQIKYARIDLMAGEENYESAERHVNEVEYMVAFNRRVVRWSNSLGTWLFIYETIWGIVLLLFLFLVLGVEAFTSSGAFGASGHKDEIVYLLGSMVWGGLGGVIGAWLSLIRHISKDQDFDRQHTMWYINSPVMGIGVGAVIYLILRAGLLSITGPNQDITSPLIIYLLAWLAGYQQNVFTGIVKRMLKVFEIEDNTAAKPSAQDDSAAGGEKESLES
jgi:hypothetical protein